jgi:transposase InsO family protein
MPGPCCCGSWLSVWACARSTRACWRARRRRTSREELRLAIITWIEKTYHRRRRQDRLGRLTPIEFETRQPAAHAA